MNFIIHAADRETGDAVKPFIVIAASEADAMEQASDRGVIVERAEIAPDPQASNRALLYPLWTTACLLAILVAMVVVQTFRSEAPPPAMQQWEYSIRTPPDSLFDESMESIGGAGWELVSARRATGTYSTPSYEMIFKRPKTDQ